MASKTDLIKEHMSLQNRLVGSQLDALKSTVETKVLTTNDLASRGTEILQTINRGKEASVANATRDAAEHLQAALKGYNHEMQYLVGRASVGDLKTFYEQGDNALAIHDRLMEAGQRALEEEIGIHEIEYGIKRLEAEKTRLYKELEAKRGKK